MWLDDFEWVIVTMMERRGWAGWLGAALVASMFAGSATAQGTASVSVNPVALVRRAVELRLQEEKIHRPVRYVLRKADGNHETTKEIIETKDGDVARLIAINGQPLTAEQEQAEMNRLDTLAAHPEMQERRFVLEPLVEIAPEWVHPVLGVMVREMLERLRPAS